MMALRIGEQKGPMSRASDDTNNVGAPTQLELQDTNRPSARKAPLSDEYARFLVSYTSALLDRSGRNDAADSCNPKPYMETRVFKPHTMDNVRVRNMCDVSVSPTISPRLTTSTRIHCFQLDSEHSVRLGPSSQVATTTTTTHTAFLVGDLWWVG